MNQRIQKHITDLQNIDNQRKAWLFLSAFVAVTIIGIIFGWNYVQANKIIWLVTSLGLLVSMTWWYWTMKLIRQIVNYKLTESEILNDLIQDIRYIKDEVKNLRQPLD